MENMTAKVSCFSRAYHFRNNKEWIFADDMADKLLTEKEFSEIAKSMADGVEFFAPEFNGSKEEALRFVVDHQLSPSVLVRSAFCERALEREIALGLSQYVLFAAGYDSFSTRCSEELKVFELDKETLLEEKKQRISDFRLNQICEVIFVPCDLCENSWKNALLEKGFQVKQKSFGSLLGISYYLSKEDFKKLMAGITKLWSEGSVICFDYPVCEEGDELRKNRALAEAAKEQMLAKYSYEEIEKILEECGFLIYEEYDDHRATDEFCDTYNRENAEHQISAPKGVHYCLAVRK